MSAAKTKKAAAKTVTESMYRVIKSPVITEKATAASEHNKITFNVLPEASKQQVKDAVEAIFGVKVLKVNTLNRKGKVKAFRGRLGLRQDTKKAVVTLEKGQSIDVAAGVN